MKLVAYLHRCDPRQKENPTEVVRIDPKGWAHVVKLKKEENGKLTWCALGDGDHGRLPFDKGNPNPLGPPGGAPTFYIVPKGLVVQT